MDRNSKCGVPMAAAAPVPSPVPSARPGPMPGQTKWWSVAVLRIAWQKWRTHALGLADQAVVSGVSFATTVLVGHWTSPRELGLYAIGISILISIVAIQDSLIALPYTIQRHLPRGTPTEHAGGSLVQSGLLSALGLIVPSGTALALSVYGAAPELVAMTWALAIVTPFALLRDFGRRYSFAHLQMNRALILDVAVAAIQLVALCWLGWTGRMSSASAYIAIGIACALPGSVWLCLNRSNFVIRTNQLSAAITHGWDLGKWLFAIQITICVQASIPYWLLALIAGPTATGIYAACMSIVLFANPFIIGIGNTLAPKAALALSEGGHPRLCREAAQDLLLLGGAMMLFCLAIFFLGDDVMRLLYSNEEYADHAHTLFVLALALLASALGMPATNALLAMERPQALLGASSLGAGVTVALVWYLMIEGGLPGAAYGFLTGSVTGSLGRWIAFLIFVPRRNACRDDVHQSGFPATEAERPADHHL
ncbi:lipopolysaccharide biosynthesis protein [Bradyrhizobium sp. WSM 1704]|uniref:lipopolysaccharide biosynthesis protein n=1 Tax=Bradyrhizobium semiaridum TaxID=2821404 RepID=UPI001CE2684F|nr:lipopolysaccharide biosynthesis protein [Bradyrhizobium semiaridum]MCA6122023.1 lipopolysaccharide biosynthesis protein [Bradyrhizobium semiaridum]